PRRQNGHHWADHRPLAPPGVTRADRRPRTDRAQPHPARHRRRAGRRADSHTTSRGQRLPPRRKFEGTDMTFLWILLGVLYLACWIYFGLATFRKGHYLMFWIGFFIPILWIIGALIAPTQRA